MKHLHCTQGAFRTTLMSISVACRNVSVQRVLEMNLVTWCA